MSVKDTQQQTKHTEQALQVVVAARAAAEP